MDVEVGPIVAYITLAQVKEIAISNPTGRKPGFNASSEGFQKAPPVVPKPPTSRTPKAPKVFVDKTSKVNNSILTRKDQIGR